MYGDVDPGIIRFLLYPPGSSQKVDMLLHSKDLQINVSFEEGEDPPLGLLISRHLFWARGSLSVGIQRNRHNLPL